MAAASPDGNPFSNKKLAQRRAVEVKAWLLSHYPEADSSKISLRAIGSDWQGLKALAAADPNLPGQKALITMIDDPALNEQAKSQELQDLMFGHSYAYLKRNKLFHRLAMATVDISYGVGPRPAAFPAETAPGPDLPPVAAVRDDGPDTAIRTETGESAAPVAAASALRPAAPEKRGFPLALRTNLLFDVTGAPNIGVEVPVGRHFSVAGDFAYAHWRINNRYALQTIQGNLEGRYWFQPDQRPLTGWNAGIYATFGGDYDVQWQSGYQGDSFWSAGLTGGYALPVSHRLNLDFSLGIGYFHTPEARHYGPPRDGHLIWEETRYNVGRFSLTKVRVDLVWFFNLKGKHKPVE